jgi:hypothetical protein
MKPVIVSIALIGCLALSSTAEAKDYLTTQDLSPGSFRLTVLDLSHVGRYHFEVRGKGSMSCAVIGIRMEELSGVEIATGTLPDLRPRAYAMGGEIAAQDKCVVNVKVEKPTTVFFLVENDDAMEHSYLIDVAH